MNYCICSNINSPQLLHYHQWGVCIWSLNMVRPRPSFSPHPVKKFDFITNSLFAFPRTFYKKYTKSSSMFFFFFFGYLFIYLFLGTYCKIASLLNLEHSQHRSDYRKCVSEIRHIESTRKKRFEPRIVPWGPPNWHIGQNIKKKKKNHISLNWFESSKCKMQLKC